MTVEIGLLILESILLCATVILLIYSIKEGKERDRLLIEVSKATKVLRRQEYFLTVTDSMMDAKFEIIGCITGRPPQGDDKKRTREIAENIERLTKNRVRVRYLIPKFHDRLHIGYLYTKAGAEVRYSNCPIVHDTRYMVVDEKLVIIGIPEVTGEKEATKKGYRIPSDGLAAILKDHFYQCWDKNITYEEYAKEVLKQTGVMPKRLARELQINEEDLQRLTE